MRRVIPVTILSVLIAVAAYEPPKRLPRLTTRATAPSMIRHTRWTRRHSRKSKI